MTWQLAFAGRRSQLLSAREHEIFAHLGAGLNNQEIAASMGLSENTVKHYITPLLQKLGVRNRTEAALFAQKKRHSE